MVGPSIHTGAQCSHSSVGLTQARPNYHLYMELTRLSGGCYYLYMSWTRLLRSSCYIVMAISLVSNLVTYLSYGCTNLEVSGVDLGYSLFHKAELGLGLGQLTHN